MKSKSKFKSDTFEAIHSAARGLHRAGAIDKATMREFDESCLTALTMIAPEEIKRIREGAHVSQPVPVAAGRGSCLWAGRLTAKTENRMPKEP